MNLTTILKMLGVKVSPEIVAQLQALIPQIPAKANELISANMAALKSFDERLTKIEELQLQILGQQDFLCRAMRQNGEKNNGRRTDSNSGGSTVDRTAFFRD